jgi:hypothetical protein
MIMQAVGFDYGQYSACDLDMVPEYLCVPVMLLYDQESVVNAGSTIYMVLNVKGVAHDIVLLHSHKICSMPIMDCVELPPL